MGTHLAFTAFTSKAADEAKVRRAFDDAIAEIQRIEALMTTWRPDAQLARVNTAAGKSAIAVSQEPFHAGKEPLPPTEFSEAAFHIRSESLHARWTSAENPRPHPPTNR